MLWERLSPSPLAIASGLSLNLALVMQLAGNRLPAIWIAALGAGLFVWGLTRKPSKLLLVLLNAIILSIPVAHFFGAIGSGGDPKSDSSADAIKDEKDGRGPNTIKADNVFPGVILFPEVQRHAVLVPPLPSIHRDPFAGSRHPLSIPFFGSYWIYKTPDRTIPKTAITMRGDPDAKTFRSTDSRPMVMEAHQNLGTFLYTACCRAIEISIRNRDRYPGSVSIALSLVNSELPGRPALSLGAMAVESTPGPTKAMLETLTYPLPAKPVLNRFDEFVIRYSMTPIRRDRSAGIAIERFVLVPR